MKKGITWRRKYLRAFTFVELVVVLAIIGLVLVAVVPRITASQDRRILEEQTRLVESELIWLRSEARRSGLGAAFIREDARSYKLQIGVTGGYDSETRTLVSDRVQLSINTGNRRIIFHTNGTVYEKGTITLKCGNQGRTLVINNMGQIRVGVANG
ncbi:MAG: type II secretion system protein [Peptococcaceae bacterium]|nr:type II secretion system protein [Peptococcaceae bacterium]